MKEESRIEALEHELKILKNEIHATLLEIREQILNHYIQSYAQKNHSATTPYRCAKHRPAPVRR